MASFLHIWRTAGLLILAAGLGASVVAQEAYNPSAAPFVFRNWQGQQGLPNITVKAITQTRDGYLWLGTAEGLARFDGLRCQVFGTRNGLKNLQITALAEDSQGALWIGTDGGGVSRMFQGEIKTYTTENGLAGDSINTLQADTNGTVWIGTTKGLNCWRNGDFQPVDKILASSAFIFSLALDHAGDLWIATLSKGLFRLHQEKLSSVPWAGQNAHEPVINARRLMVDHENRLWLGMRDRSVLSLNLTNGNWQGYGRSEGLPLDYPSCLAETPDGIIWVGFQGRGLCYLRPNANSFTAVRTRDGLPDNAVLSLYANQNQRLWIGSVAGGLCRISPKKISVYHVLEYVSPTTQTTNTTDPAEGSQLSLTQTTNGDLWVGSYGQGIYQWRSNAFTPYLPVLGNLVTFHVAVDAVLGASDGSLWWGAGPAVFQSKENVLLSSTNYDGVPWLNRRRVLSLCESRAGGMWVGTDDGQVRLIKQGVVGPDLGGRTNKPITDLAEEPDGTLWIATLGAGLARLQNGQLTFFTTREGLTSDLVRTLLLDPDGDLWIGTEGGGLNLWSQGRITGFTTKNGLPDDIVLQILEDNEGSQEAGLWLGCNHGICRLNKRVLLDMAEGKPNYLRPLVFDTADGLVSDQCVGSFNAALKTHSGLLCFSTVKGIVVINPHQISQNETMPTVLLENVLVDKNILETHSWSSPTDFNQNEEDPPGPVPVIPPGRHSFDFNYVGIEFDAPEKVQFRYWLVGIDAIWNDVGDVRQARYAYIPPGSYHFRVQARNLNGRWSEPGVVMTFVVLPHFWQEAWFQVFAGIILTYMVALNIRALERRRYRLRLEKIEHEQAMERERIRIASDLHDELGANLTHISMLSNLGQSEAFTQADKLKKRMRTISSASVRTVRSLDEIVWAVNPRNDSLRSLILYLTQFTRELYEDSDIHCRFHTGESLPELPLPPEMRHNLFLVVKEALNNALKYSKATEISLSATTSEGQIKICVQDNGSGFCLTTVQSTSKRNGLGNMRQRIEALGGQFVVEAHPGKGTAIRLTVNYPNIAQNQNKK